MKKQRPQKPLRILLEEIDGAVEDHKRRLYKDSNIHLTQLLDELKAHHPLSLWTRRHGQRLVDELFGEEKKSVYEFSSRSVIEKSMREVFQLPNSGSIIGAVSRDLRRIASSFAEPFYIIGEKLGTLYAIIREIRGK